MTRIALQAVVACGVDHADGVCIAAFADFPDAPKRYLMLQRGIEDDAQDRQMGMDTYYVEWCDQGWSLYGGVEAFFLGQSSAHVVFTPLGAERLGGLEQLSIDFQVSEVEWHALYGALAAIFRGTDRLAVADS